MVGIAGVVPAAIAAAAFAGSAPGARCQGECHGDSGKQRLVVRERVVHTGATYIEGAYSFLTVRRRSGAVVFHRRYSGRMHLNRAFRRGRYRIASYVRSCAGSCDYLDPPSDRCDAKFRLRESEPVRAVIRTAVGERCRIRFDGS
jgi:hypothetical protein